jgi:glycosyltransferase involved in cell wall biosynthesis
LIQENKKPLVTIIATCFNQESYLEETLDSILNQTYSNIQLIIMDDCSSDDSAIKIEEWKKRRNQTCLFIHNEANKGVCATLNEGLTHAEGEYFQGIACDDVMLPNKIERQVDCFLSNKKISLAHSTAVRIDGRGQVISDRFVLSEEMKEGEQESEWLIKKMIWANTVIAASVLIKVADLPKAPVYNESFRIEDLYLNLYLLTAGKNFYFLDEPLVKYRVLETSVMRAPENKVALKMDRQKIVKQFLGNTSELDYEIFTYLNKSIKVKDAIKALIIGNMPMTQFKLKIRSKLQDKIGQI